MLKNKPFGKELILDLFVCNIPTTRENLTRFFEELCDLINMEREDLHFWDYEGDPEGYEKAEDHLKGISAIQFIKTSNITVHTIDVQKKVLINIFSCKGFNQLDVEKFCFWYFGAKKLNSRKVERG